MSGSISQSKTRTSGSCRGTASIETDLLARNEASRECSRTPPIARRIAIRSKALTNSSSNGLVNKMRDPIHEAHHPCGDEDPDIFYVRY